VARNTERRVKVREKRSRDFQNGWYIKNEDKRILTKDNDVKKMERIF